MKMGEVKESKLGMEMYLTKVNIGTYVFINMFKVTYVNKYVGGFLYTSWNYLID